MALGGYKPIGLEPTAHFSVGQFTLFPNPVGDQLFVSAPDGLHDPINYRIFNLSGALLMSGIFNQSASKQIETTLLTEGIYVVHLISGPVQEVHKIIIAR